MKSFLLRLAEPGREVQQVRRKTRRDVIARLAVRLPEAEVTTLPGRVVITGGGDESVIRDIHGVLSYSPGRLCDLGELEAAAVAEARDHLAAAASFRVRARVRNLDESTRAVESRIGAVLLAELPGLAVDLVDPDVTVGVEIHGAAAFVFCRTEPGLDQRAPNTPAAAAECSSRSFPDPGRSQIREFRTLVAEVREDIYDSVLDPPPKP